VVLSGRIAAVWDWEEDKDTFILSGVRSGTHFYEFTKCLRYACTDCDKMNKANFQKLLNSVGIGDTSEAGLACTSQS
jgi:hypothetical protein